MMSLRIVGRAAQARCYECGSPAIALVCHHCGRAACKEHAHRRSDLRGRPVSAEFTDLGLKGSRCGEAPVHCADCDHVLHAPSYLFTGVGVIIAVIGAVLLRERFSYAALVLILLGLGLIAGTYLVNRRLQAAMLTQRPPLPLLPRINSARVNETVVAKVTLDSAGRYHVDVQPTSGTLEISASLLQGERERLAQYRGKYRLAPEQPVPFHAGFAALAGKAGIALTAAGSADMHAPNIITLHGQVAELPFLAGGRESDLFSRTYTYQVFDPPKPMALPISLAPSFIQEADERALDLEFQWINPRQWGEPLPIERITLLRIDVPIAWGAIQHVSGNALMSVDPISSPAGPVRRIEWSQLPIDDADSRKDRRFSILFANRVDRADSIHGRIEVSFKGALSAITGVDLFYPLGLQRTGINSRVSTTVAIDFELSLAGVRYQDARVVPNLKLAHDQQRLASMPLIFEGVIPDYATVIALTNALSNRGFYVKRTIENPPRVGERVNVRNRYWDIAGRRYISVYPIDFHIVLIGEEVYGGDIRAQGGTTRISLTVHGAYANAEMEAQITQLWDDLYALIDDTIGTQPHLHSAAQAAAASEQTMTGEAVASFMTAPYISAASRTSVDLARERLNALIDALVDGRMSQVKIFQELSTIAQYLEQFSSTTTELRQSEVGG